MWSEIKWKCDVVKEKWIRHDVVRDWIGERKKWGTRKMKYEKELIAKWNVRRCDVVNGVIKRDRKRRKKEMR